MKKNNPFKLVESKPSDFFATVLFVNAINEFIKPLTVKPILRTLNPKEFKKSFPTFEDLKKAHELFYTRYYGYYLEPILKGDPDDDFNLNLYCLLKNRINIISLESSEQFKHLYKKKINWKFWNWLFK